MSNNNNNKQPLDPTESLPVFDKAQAPSTTTPTVNKLDYVGISLDIPEINQPDVTTRNLSHSDQLTIGILLDCVKRGQNRGNQRAPFICKVPRVLRDHSESSFEPQLVSIGPIHREDPKLKEFEWMKECYLYDLLERFYFTPKKTLLEAFLLEVNDLIPQIRESYAGVKKNYSDDDLARMMVMDGCFILEFCFKHEQEDLHLPNKMQNLRIAMDLILLENQVPFVVLQTLFNCNMAPYIGSGSVTLSQVLDNYLAPYIKLFCLLPEKKSILTNVLDKYLAPYIKLFCSLLPEKISTTDVDTDSTHDHVDTDSTHDHVDTDSTHDHVDTDSTHDHVLGYLYRRYQLNSEDQPIENTASHSIVELDRSGMNFEPHQEDEWSMTIEFRLSSLSSLPWFWVCCCCGCCCCRRCCFLFPRLLSGFCSKPTLRMPTLLIDDITELILRNFIAYEQSFPDQERYYFTSYARAMDMLIDTQEDIAKLVESKVLFNMLGSNQEAADMINKICKNMHVTKFYYTEEFRKMDKYYSGCCRDHIAQLRRVYFSNPWSIIALVAAIILFSLTVVQTVFAIRAA